jgi:flavin reductase (DIM6/NTAB) family NADH-FMN oxidoreductase RutF
VTDLLAPGADVMRQALRRLATGVTIVSFIDERGEPGGMTANAVCAVSLEPPLLLVCLNRSSRTWAAVERSRRFGICLLHEGQRAIAELCARPGEDKRLDPRWVARRPEAAAPPVIAGALAAFHCEIAAVHSGGTHEIVVGRVRDVILGDKVEPLTYFEGAYRQLDPAPERRVDALWDLLGRYGH